jgi:hypothetical protein
LTNTTSGVPITALATDLIKLTDELEPALPAEWQPMAEADPALLALTGPWFWGPTPYTLHLLADGWLDLRPASGSGRASRFRPAPDGTWAGLDGYYAGETLQVVRRADGTASHLDLATFIFTRTPYDPAAPIPGGLDERGWRTRD